MNRPIPQVLGSTALAVCLAQTAHAQCDGNLFWPPNAPQNESRYLVFWGGQVGGDQSGYGQCYEPTPVLCENTFIGQTGDIVDWEMEGLAGRGVLSIDQHSWGGNYGNMGSQAKVGASGWVTFTGPTGVSEMSNVWMTFDIDASIDEADYCCSNTAHIFAVGFPSTQQWLDGGRLNHDFVGSGCGTGVFSEGVNFDGSDATFARRVAVGPFTVPVGVPVNIGVAYAVYTGAGQYFSVYHAAHVALPADAPVFILPDDSYSADSADFAIVDNWWSDPRVVVTDQPDDTAGCVGGAVEFGVAADGEGPITYAWRRNGTDLVNGPTSDGSIISGADTATLTISTAHGSDAGTYDCVVSNTYAQVESDPASLSFSLGDFNCDGTVDAIDLGILLGAWGNADDPADLNGDGAVDASDLAILLGAWSG
jgi:hypothetical protein